VAAAHAEPHAPRPTAAEPAPPRELEDDDDGPITGYAVPAEVPTRVCAGCAKRVPVVDVICTQCGFNSQTQTTTERVYEKINRSWEVGWSLDRRIMLMLILFGFDALSTLVSWWSGATFVPMIVGLSLIIGLQAFIVGTYDRIKVTRSAKGGATVSKVWRVAFIEQPVYKYRWKEYDSIRYGKEHELTAIDYWLLIVLAIQLVLPAILWYWFVLRPDRSYIAFCKHHGAIDTYLYRSTNDEQAQDLARTLATATGLPVEGL
jgi:hypothetical protein